MATPGLELREFLSNMYFIIVRSYDISGSASELHVDEMGLGGRARVGQHLAVHRGGAFEATVAPDLQPGGRVGREASEGGAEALVEQGPAPLVREAGDGLRRGEREGADVTMGAARDDDVGAPGEVTVDPVTEGGVAGDVDHGGRVRRERSGRRTTWVATGHSP